MIKAAGPSNTGTSSYKINSRRRSTLVLIVRWPVQKPLHRQLDAAFFVGFQNLDLDDLAFGQVISHFVDTLVGARADMQQALLAEHQITTQTELPNLCDRAYVNVPHFPFGG